MSPARHLLQEWPSIARRLRSPKELTLFTDFDGTLVPIRRHHTGGRAPARVKKVLRDIAAQGAVVGVISGRRLEDVKQRVHVPGLWYVGAHGFFLCDPANRSIVRVNPTKCKRMMRLARRLTRALRGVHGVGVEPKAATVAIHYRGARPEAVLQAKAIVNREQGREPGLHLMSGKKIWEFTSDVRVDKWSAIRLILARERRRNARAGRVVVYLGDDTTDETVFRGLRGVTVAVGKRHRTAARYYLRSPKEVRRFLECLSEGMP